MVNQSDQDQRLAELLAASCRVLQTLAPLLPTLSTVEAVIESTKGAVARGYFLPDEDDRVRDLFSNYLTIRAALLSTLEDLRPYAMAELGAQKGERPEVFVVSYALACLLMRSGRFVVDSFCQQRVVWRKLDEATRAAVVGAASAKALMLAQAEGVPRSILFTSRGNDPARRAYEALGYEIVGDYHMLFFAEAQAV